MIIRSANFIKSSTQLSQCPPPDKAEFAFIGRSNVGKSSLINMLTGYSKLAKTSSTPGKTQTINHFVINEDWYLADLPGYGYAKVSKTSRSKWLHSSYEYILKRENLISLFVLIDSRHEPQNSDVKFMEFLGKNQISFARIFTKADKSKERDLKKTIQLHDEKMLTSWESLPPTFITSAIEKTERDLVLNYIKESLSFFNKQQ